MNNESNNKKGSALKILAVAGFIGIIIIIAWLSIQLVNVMPNAFSSLASLAEGLNQQSFLNSEEESSKFTVTSDSTWINVGETVNLSWDTARAQGSYTFSYACVDGVSVDIQDTDNGLRNVTCDTNYNIGNTDTLSLTIESEKKRFANVEYTISFLATNDTTPRASGTAALTVINSTISDTLVDSQDIAPEETTEPEQEIAETAPTQNTTQAGAPTYQQEFVYTIPTSDPNGRTDLAVRFLNTGSIVVDTFFPGQIAQNENGALQFEVKNYGTKTSEKWTYNMTLPGGGEYTSTDQTPLKPNEVATITIGFPTTDDSSHTFVVEIDETTDRNTLNDRFSQTIIFVK